MVAVLSPVANGATNHVAALGDGAVVSAVIVIGAGAAVLNNAVTSAAVRALLYIRKSSMTPWKLLPTLPRPR